MHQIAHVKSPHQLREVTLANMRIDGGADGGDKTFEVLPRDVWSVVEAMDGYRVPLS